MSRSAGIVERLPSAFAESKSSPGASHESIQLTIRRPVIKTADT
jgi:hypothetical protein